MGAFKDYLEQDMMGGGMGGGMGGPPGGGMDPMGGGGMPGMGGPPMGGPPGMGGIGGMGGPGMGMDPMGGGMGGPGMGGPKTTVSVEPQSIWDIWEKFFGLENKEDNKDGNDPSDMLQSGSQEQEPKQSEFLMSAPGVT